LCPEIYHERFVDVNVAGNILCGLTSRSMAYIIYRGFTGIGAAGILQGSATMLNHGVEPSLREGCMKFVVTAEIIALSSGAMLGGYVTDNISWKWIHMM
jgi:MFS family permease